MLKTRVIPCLDVDGGRVVKGVNFQNLRDSGDPTALAMAYQLQGADEIVVLDISATTTKRAHQIEVIAAIRELLDGYAGPTIGVGDGNDDDAVECLGGLGHVWPRLACEVGACFENGEQIDGADDAFKFTAVYARYPQVNFFVGVWT